MNVERQWRRHHQWSGRQRPQDGGRNNDTLDGGTGPTPSSASATAGVIGGPGAHHSAQNTGGAGTQPHHRQFLENLTGSAFSDILAGSTGDNVIHGGAGDDLILGGAGNDTLDGGKPVSTTYGDTVSYQGSRRAA